MWAGAPWAAFPWASLAPFAAIVCYGDVTGTDAGDGVVCGDTTASFARGTSAAGGSVSGGSSKREGC